MATGQRLVFISGQVSMDAAGKLVAPGDVAGQARQVYANLRAALEGAGATPADVTKLTTYVVGYRPELRPLLAEARQAVFGAAAVPASTLVGVQALAELASVDLYPTGLEGDQALEHVPGFVEVHYEIEEHKPAKSRMFGMGIDISRELRNQVGREREDYGQDKSSLRIVSSR